MLEIRGLRKRLGNFELGELSLTLEAGTTHVLLGPTGCGKTSLFECVLGLHEPDVGEIHWAGQPLTGVAPGQRGISYVPQDLALFPHLSVAQNIRYPLRVRRQGDASTLMEELIDAVGIRPLLDRAVTHLSGGERQRVALVRALVAGERCLLLDEPFAALHEGLKHDLWFLLRDLQQRYGLTIMLITHDLAEAFFLGDTLSIMLDGRLAQTGTKAAIYDAPATLEVARFLGIRNLFPAERTEQPHVLHCPSLGCSLELERAPTANADTPIWLGIRAEDVVVVPEPATLAETRNQLTGTFRTAVDLGQGYLATMQPDSGSDPVTYLLARHHHDPHATQTERINLAMPPERLFAVTTTHP